MADRLRRSQQALRLVVPERAPIRRVLLLSHVDQAIPLESTLERAVQAFHSSSQTSPPDPH